MRILMIGGTGFIGGFVVRELLRQGHEVTLFHRSRSEDPLLAPAHQISGDRNDLAAHVSQFQQLAPDVVLDVILSSERQARALVDAFSGIAGRLVALSSMDVYRACGILHGTEPGPPQELPLTETSELRTQPPYPQEVVRKLKGVFPWLDNEYDKVPVERVVMGGQLPGTVLRLPMVYGPGDPLHRLFPILKRIDDRRPAILLHEDVALWRGSRGYVENVAAAVALAVVSVRAAGTIYNVCEPEAFTELEWTRRVAAVRGWDGSVMAVPREQTPAHLRVPYNTDQHWVANSARIREELGFAEPVPLEAALDRTIAWERAHPPAEIDPKQFDYAAEDAWLGSNNAADLRSRSSGP